MAFFAARQPILDSDKKLFGYELLFRSSLDNVFPDMDEEKATSKMIQGLQFDLGLDRLSDGKLAFINFTEESLLKEYPLLLPNQKVVVEVLETVQPSKALYACLKKLKSKQYILALDDFVHSDAWEPFYKLFSIIKIDYLEASEQQILDTIAVKQRFPHIELLAEKVETHEVFKRAIAQGFTYFQGYFFSRPEVIESAALTPSQSMLTSLLSEVTKAEPNFNQITKIFELDVTLSFKLLRYTKSPLFQRRKAIENIKQAVLVLGKTELERFIALLFAASFGEGKPTELVRLSMHRAKFCESLAHQMGHPSEESSAFLVGMLSLLDAMLDADLTQVIESLPLSTSIKSALLGGSGWLADCITLCRAFEAVDWRSLEATSRSFEMDYDKMLDDYDDAGKWAESRILAII